MVLLLLLAALTTVSAGWRAWRRLRHFLHVFQLEGYKPNEYRAWLGRRGRGLVVRPSHLAGAALLALAWIGFFHGPARATAVAALVLWGVFFASAHRYRTDQQKKPLAFTPRLKRLLAASAALAALPVVAGAVAGLATGTATGFFWYLLGALAADFGAPFWVLLAAYALRPVERRIQEGFKAAARRRLAERRDLTIVGITGSYGKTSVKFIIAEILRQRFNVLATPGSFNTPMGICLVVNNQLRPEHQVLVLEMGARYRGDIRELCEIAAPDLAVVTSVGVAHLETMGPIENIAREKGSLIEHARPGAPVILNADNPYVAAMTDRATGRVWRVSVEGNPAEISASDIRYGPEGATFIVRDETGDEQEFHTRLLGAHNILNILLGVAVGRELGLRLRQIARGVARVEPVEHRLQLRTDGGVTVIDDAFNSNPVGARNAVDILGQFTSGRRIIVTPGMVELGERQYEENRAFGEHMAGRVDLALLIGPEQTRPIQDGLRAAGFPEDRLHVFLSFFEAQDFLRATLRPGDVVLYENDLPDQYNEAPQQQGATAS